MYWCRIVQGVQMLRLLHLATRCTQLVNLTLHVYSKTYLAYCCGEIFKYAYYKCVECLNLYYDIGEIHTTYSFCNHWLKSFDLTYLKCYMYSETNKVIAWYNVMEPIMTFNYLQETGNFS